MESSQIVLLLVSATEYLKNPGLMHHVPPETSMVCFHPLWDDLEMKPQGVIGQDALFLMSTPVDATPLEKKKDRMRRPQTRHSRAMWRFDIDLEAFNYGNFMRMSLIFFSSEFIRFDLV